ncbi:GDSL esterase/lipase [Hibiscus syriacus]|uniref:GDSL esterase/lipase n=1 Tax=Hibiscus syriacus TaxID=106335 RepID=A0A6A3BG09_HIBSY|nr:GDSL esterase/lipase At1g28610-like [Hibiscus syriacus]KAE8713679.1 GDSL esterase/lipase [Hibiscus syriacus]
MASCSWLKQRFIVIISVFVTITSVNSPVNGCFTSIFSFGDSLTDTGNLLEISISESSRRPHSAFPPYGRTYFHHPTGRYCDGRLVIDFLAEALGFSLLPPFYGSKSGGWEEFQKGVNFAVAGATALNSSFLAEQGILSVSTNISLGVEVNSFKNLLPSLCSPSLNCREFLRNSLIVMGEIGGNDYNHPFWQGKNTEKIRQLVPLVVGVITSSINELIKLGAETFLVPGNFPIGCSPSFLARFQGSSKDQYDPLTGCLTWLNQFTEYHNELLRRELHGLRNQHPDINIIYVDYYNISTRIYHSPEQFGFKETLKACCGTGGVYNYDPSKSCGYPPLDRCCKDPSSYINWDGIHYTDAANRWFASVAFAELMNAIPSLEALCPTSTLNKLGIMYPKSEM